MSQNGPQHGAYFERTCHTVPGSVVSVWEELFSLKGRLRSCAHSQDDSAKIRNKFFFLEKNGDWTNGHVIKMFFQVSFYTKADFFSSKHYV